MCPHGASKLLPPLLVSESHDPFTSGGWTLLQYFVKETLAVW